MPNYSQLIKHDAPTNLDDNQDFKNQVPHINMNYMLIWRKIEELKKELGRDRLIIHNVISGGPGALDHTLLANLNSVNYYHTTQAQYNSLTGGLDSILHYHATDRARANHTGTQVAATISDFTAAARLTINATVPVLYDNVAGTISLAGLAALGAANQVLGMNALGTAYEYKTLTGTANRVTVTHGAGTVTFSGPQDIHTAASPQFVGETLTGNLTMSTGQWLGLGAAGLRLSWDGASAEIDVLGGGFDMNSNDIAHGGNIHADAGKLYADTETVNTLVYLDASHGITTMGAATNGQLAIGSTGVAPVLATITATADQTTITNGAGSITVGTVQSIGTGSSPTFTGLTLTGLTENRILHYVSMSTVNRVAAFGFGLDGLVHPIPDGSIDAADRAIVLANYLQEGLSPLIVSVLDLTDYIAGTANQITVTDDTDGTITLSLPSDVKLAAAGSLDCYTNAAYFKPRRVSQAAQPTPESAELLIWHDTDDDSIHLVYQDPTAGTVEVALA